MKENRHAVGDDRPGTQGFNLVRRLLRDGEHQCVVCDRNATVVHLFTGDGATEVGWVQQLAAGHTAPRAVWVMVPPGAITDSVVDELAQTLEPGDTVIDGGNSYYRDDMHAELSVKRGIRLLDCGTSGGVWGLDAGTA